MYFQKCAKCTIKIADEYSQIFKTFPKGETPFPIQPPPGQRLNIQHPPPRGKQLPTFMIS